MSACGWCDGCKWGGACQRDVPTGDALTGDGRVWQRGPDGVYRDVTPSDTAPSPVVPSEAVVQAHSASEESTAPAVDTLSDDDALRLLSTWLRRLLKGVPDDRP